MEYGLSMLYQKNLFFIYVKVAIEDERNYVYFRLKCRTLGNKPNFSPVRKIIANFFAIIMYPLHVRQRLCKKPHFFALPWCGK